MAPDRSPVDRWPEDDDQPLAVETGYFALQFTLVGVVFGLLRDDAPAPEAGRPGRPA